MKKPKAILKRLLFPPLWLMMILVTVSTTALVLIFLKHWEESPAAYAVYALSAYTLTTVCLCLSRAVPKRYRHAKQLVYDHPLGNRYMTDAAFKVKVSLYISLAVNMVYSLFKLATGIYYSSFWWGAIAVYYIVLSVMRFLLLLYMRSSEQHLLREYKSYRICGILMAALNLSLTGIVFQMVWQGKAYVYPEIMVIASAAYTFYTVTVSIIDIIRYRKYKSPVMSAAKAIRFAAALVSLLSLETAMLAAFGGEESFSQLMTALTGSAVCIIVMVMSVYMIVRSCREISSIKANDPETDI